MSRISATSDCCNINRYPLAIFVSLSLHYDPFSRQPTQVPGVLAFHANSCSHTASSSPSTLAPYRCVRLRPPLSTMSSSDLTGVSESARSKLDAAIVSTTEQANLTAQLQALLDSYPDIANHTIHHTLPLKVQHLTQLHTHFSSLPPPPPPIIQPPASSPPHHTLLALLATLKQEIDTMLQAIDTLRIHVSLTIPRMRDQKGLAVVVKEEVVDMLGQGRNSAQGVLDGLPRYFSTRGKLISKCIKVHSTHSTHNTLTAQPSSQG